MRCLGKYCSYVVYTDRLNPVQRSPVTVLSPLHLLSIGLAAAVALGKRGAHVVVSSRRQANVDKAVALLRSQSVQVTGTTCNVGSGVDREKLVQTVSPVLRGASEESPGAPSHKEEMWAGRSQI